MAEAAKVLNASELMTYLQSFLKNRCLQGLQDKERELKCGMAKLILDAFGQVSQDDGEVHSFQSLVATGDINYSKPKSAVYNNLKAEIMTKIGKYHRDDRVYLVPSKDVKDPIQWILRMNFFYDDDFKNLTKSTILYILTQINAHTPITFPPLIEFEARMRRLLLRSESEACKKNKKIIDENPIHQRQYDALDELQHIKWNNELGDYDYSNVVDLPWEEDRINRTCNSTNAKRKWFKSSHVESCKRILTKRRHYDKVFGKGKCDKPLQKFNFDTVYDKKEGWMKRIITNPRSIPAIFLLKLLLLANRLLRANTKNQEHSRPDPVTRTRTAPYQIGDYVIVNEKKKQHGTEAIVEKPGRVTRVFGDIIMVKFDMGGFEKVFNSRDVKLQDISLQPSLKSPILKSPSLKSPSLKSPSLQQPSLKSPSLKESLQQRSLQQRSLQPSLKSSLKSSLKASINETSPKRTVKTRSSPNQQTLTTPTLKVRPPLTIPQNPKPKNVDDDFKKLPKNLQFPFQMDNVWFSVVVHSKYAELESKYTNQILKIYKPSSYHFWQTKLKERSIRIFSEIYKQYRALDIQKRNNAVLQD
jgi:hypothetical protein